jgi:cytochrome c oxidase subunit 2
MKGFIRTVLLGSLPLVLAMGAAEASQPKPWELYFQDAASPVMREITQLHDILTVIITLITLFVMGLLLWVMWRYRASRNPQPATWSHNTPLEIAWTTIPVIILLIIAIPSFRLLYFMDRTNEADMTLKITGHQWYWSYEYPDQKIGFDSLFVQDKDLKPGQPRLLTVDNHVVLPVGKNIRLLMTADDVIHAWAIPAFGVKTDTVPGRTNESWVKIERPGIYYGQCSELCGVNHAYMPITVEAVTPEQFETWLGEARKKFALDGGAATEQLAQKK